MRSRPSVSKTKEEKFIENARADVLETSTVKEDLHRYVKRASWPLDSEKASPSFAEGSDLKKPMLINLSEKEWNSIDRHTKVIGVSKQEWVRHAMYKLLENEQLHFLNTQDS